MNLLTRREGEGRWFKVDYQGLKSLFLHSLDIHGEVKIAFSSFGGFTTLKKKERKKKKFSLSGVSGSLNQTPLHSMVRTFSFVCAVER